MKIIDAFGTKQVISVGPYIDGLSEIAAIASGDFILLHDDSGQVLGKFDATQIGGGGVSWENIIIVAKSGGDYSTIAGAIAVAASGDVILVMPGTYSECTLDLPANVGMFGYSVLNTEINCSSGSYAISMADNSELRGIQVNLGSAGKVIYATGTDALIEDVKINSSINDASDLYGIYAEEGGTIIRNCYVSTVNAGAGTAYDVFGATGVYATYVYGGTFYGDDKNFYAESLHDIFSYEFPSITGSITGDINGSFVIRGTSPMIRHTAAIRLSTGASVNEFSSDGTLAGDSDLAVPTEKAVKTYVDNNAGDPFFYYGW
jgi:hypothetical protein